MIYNQLLIFQPTAMKYYHYSIKGGAIYIHAFGAYFGLAVAMMSRKRDVEKAAHMEASRYTSDIFSLVSVCSLRSLLQNIY